MMSNSFLRGFILIIVLALTPFFNYSHGIEKPKFVKRLNLDIEFDAFNKKAVDFHGDTMFYFSFSSAQKYAYTSNYSFFTIDVKRGSYKEYQFELPPEIKSKIRKTKSIFHDIEVAEGKVYILYTYFILSLKYDFISDSYKVEDCHRLPSAFFYFHYIIDGKMICNRLYYSEKQADAELLLYSVSKGKKIKTLEINPFPGSDLVKYKRSQWISHNRKYTVVSYIDKYELKLYNHKLELIDEKRADSLMAENKFHTNKYSSDKYNNKQAIIKNRAIVDSLHMVRKISFVNDSLLMVVRSNKKCFDKKQVMLDYWVIKNGTMGLLKSNIVLSVFSSSPALINETITKENLPFSAVVDSSPLFIHKNYLIALNSHHKGRKDVTEFFGTSTYKEYLNYTETGRGLKDYLSLIFFSIN